MSVHTHPQTRICTHIYIHVYAHMQYTVNSVIFVAGPVKMSLWEDVTSTSLTLMHSKPLRKPLSTLHYNNMENKLHMPSL